MQLFPVGESDVLRTRLTHSLEVSEIAMRIASVFNSQIQFFRENPIDLQLVATAALGHDLGHPPFGHSGELALHQLSPDGSEGYEGNAQTLRIVTRLENRLTHSNIRNSVQAVYDNPFGLNLTYRTLASLIKYDENIFSRIAVMRDEHNAEGKPTEDFDRVRSGSPVKGYYRDDKNIVDDIKSNVLGLGWEGKSLKTIECQIMDIADDIAYSTYDLEDAMVSGEVQPFDLLSCDDDLVDKIVLGVNSALKKSGYRENIRPVEVIAVLTNIFDRVLHFADSPGYQLSDLAHRVVFVARSYRESKLHAKDAIIRRRFTEALISRAVDSLTVAVDEKCPVLSKVKIPLENLLEIECMKAFNYNVVIASPRLKTYNHRAKEIIGFLYEKLSDNGAEELIPYEMRPYLQLTKGEHASYRRVVDLISGMTDADALSLYDKLRSSNQRSIFGY